MASILGDLSVAPLDEVFALSAAFQNDSAPKKVNLLQGVYRDDTCNPWILPSVKAAKEIIQTSNLDHEYLPIHGYTPFLDLAKELVFGPSLQQSKASVSSVQTIAGTGANHLAALFLGRYLKPRNVFISDPTWNNHHLVWQIAAPNVNRRDYPYYCTATRSLDLEGMISTLEEEAVEHDVVLLHPCAHNPTGIDPTREQWQQIAEIVKRKKLFALFDSAYQGFASGDLDADAWAIRYFYTTLWDGGAAEPAGMAVCQSFSKNFGLYGERVGALHLVTPPSVPTQGAYSQLVRLVRSDISNAPRFGVRIVETVLSHPTLREGWCDSLQTMSQRIRDVRQALRREFERLGTKGDWSHVTSQVGMFSYTGLTKLQVDKLRELHHVYLLQTGRLSLPGVNSSNVEYVAWAIHDIVERFAEHNGPERPR